MKQIIRHFMEHRDEHMALLWSITKRRTEHALFAGSHELARAYMKELLWRSASGLQGKEITIDL